MHVFPLNLRVSSPTLTSLLVLRQFSNRLKIPPKVVSGSFSKFPRLSLFWLTGRKSKGTVNVDSR